MFRTKTNKGRVVYDRPKHEFTIKDLERIWRKLGQKPRGREENREFLRVLKNLLLEIIRWLSDNPEVALSLSVMLSLAMVLDNLTDFCSGDMKDPRDYPTGGGGASRDI